MYTQLDKVDLFLFLRHTARQGGSVQYTQPDKVGLYLYLRLTARWVCTSLSYIQLDKASLYFSDIQQDMYWLEDKDGLYFSDRFNNNALLWYISFEAFCKNDTINISLMYFYLDWSSSVLWSSAHAMYLFKYYIQSKLHSWKISFALCRHSVSTLHEHWLALMFTLKNVSLSWCPGCWNMSKKTATSKQCDHFSPLHWLSAMFQVNKQGLKWPWNNGLYLFTTVAHLPI